MEWAGPHKGGTGRAHNGADAIRVERSWQRCAASHHVDPAQGWAADILSGAEFRHVSGRSVPLMRAAQPEMRRLFDLVHPLGLLVLLADTDAMLLARCADESQSAHCRRMCLQQGAIWDEAIAGTNGVGTCVRDGDPLFLGQGEHWRFCLSLLASFATPIYDAQGQMVGALNLAAFHGDSSRHAAPLLMDTLIQAGRRIEEHLFRTRYDGRKVLLLDTADGCSTPLVAIDDDGQVVGATRAARTLMHWTDEMIREQPNLLSALEGDDSPSFRKAEESVIHAALAATQGNVTRAARGLGISRATLYRKMRQLAIA
ncbi:helix-turn-helix domain-containing protein [Gluconacetobacter takamatsuzukensis]|uniref:Fis family transcriptional regulator n=1 Tax=Gluconacetobacter takamatsuzukensis TaxID=1286190 RepID=A0A7W4PPP3_9PROT|nr:helix-turn-helix domain-containing protein [Gluconacetobacter takamatsuzukensis]MBB2205448.1 Fis family transcriptional regulator [Gluconacetobacter takamatsuzukensis]